jgi:Tol biopolymer transport system component
MPRVPVLGGPSTKLISNITTDFSFSPDGKEITFKRASPAFDSYDVMVAKVDGTGERKLTSRRVTRLFAAGGPAWSPDGNVIVYAGEIGPRTARLFEISLANGTERELGSQSWSNVWRINWLSDSTSLIILAQSNSALPSQIWQLSYPAAELKRITNDGKQLC